MRATSPAKKPTRKSPRKALTEADIAKLRRLMAAAHADAKKRGDGPDSVEDVLKALGRR